MGAWIAFHEQRIITYVPQKCGSTSFQVATTPGLKEVVKYTSVHTGHAAVAYYMSMNMGPLTFPQAMVLINDGYRSIISVREPVSRFLSIWSYICNNGRDDELRKITNGLTPTQFLKLIENAPNGNGHWWPQYMGILPGSIPVKFNRLLPILGYEPVHVHMTTKVKPTLTAEEIAMIHRIYDKDFTLWANSVDSL